MNREDLLQREGLLKRAAAVGAVALVAIAVAVALLSAGEPYQVRANFQNASQLVTGNRVQSSGQPIGQVTDIRLTEDGQAEVTMEIDASHAPLRRGTTAIVRQASLSGIANRYVDLHLAPSTARDIPDGGLIEAAQTRASVDLDQLFNAFDPATRRGTRDTIKGFAESYAGRAEVGNEAWRLLNPALATTARLFRELNRNQRDLERFVVETSRLTTDVAARRDDVAGLVRNLATTSSALAAERRALGDSIGQLPGFMRTANTTFVNLRATLDDLDPLVEASRPVVRRLRPLFAQLRPFARDAVPTIRDLSRTIRRSGAGNDLIELLNRQVPLERIANGPVRANGAEREGAFPASARALQGSVEPLAFARPYAVDLSGWFDDFSASGGYDALGSYSRAGLALGAFTFTPALELVPVPPALRRDVVGANTRFGRNNRCPGSMERTAPDGSNPFRPSPDYDCDPTQVPIGP